MATDDRDSGAGAGAAAPRRSARPWQFPDSEVRVLGGDGFLLGKGAYGEVRKAVWRGIPVAAKRLHMLSGTIPGLRPEEVEAVRLQFVQEMEMLSYLRHPNLLLFIGVSYDRVTRSPLWIVTEYMQTSLYSMIHDQRLTLTLPEIVDVAVGIVGGLQYLHQHDPPIIHRDVSSKNILIDGPSVKISDLGQAKFYDVAAARQTAAPGALVYAAPEVLTGRYTPKIDIFSFGVLLVQMCVGEYPAIDSRPEHTERACKAHPCLQKLITACISMDPSFRPSASEAKQMLEDIKLTPAYTGDAHEHGGGVIVERVFRAAQERAKDEGVERGKRMAVNDWSKKYENMKIAAHKYRTKAKDMEALVQATQQRVTKAAEAQTASRRTIRDLESHVEELRSELREEKERTESDVSRLARENGTLQKTLKKREAREEELQKQVVAERKERVSLEGALRAISERMQTTRKSQTQSEQKSEAMAQMLESVEARLKTREDELTDARDTIETLLARITALEGEVKTLTDKLDSEATSRKQLNVRMADMKDTVVRAHARVVEMETEAADARKQADEAIAARDEALAQARHATDAAAAAQSAVVEAKAKLASAAGAGGGGGGVEPAADGDGDGDGASALDALLDEPPPGPLRRKPSRLRAGTGDQALSTTMGTPLPAGPADASVGTDGGDGGTSNQHGDDGEAPFLPRLESTASGLGDAAGTPRSARQSQRPSNASAPGGVGSAAAAVPHGGVGVAGGEGAAPGGGTRSRGGSGSKAIVEAAIRLGLDAVITAMREHPTRVGVQWRACNHLREKASESDEARTMIAIHGGIGAVLIAMRTFPMDVNTQQYGSRALMNLAFKSDDNRSQIVGAGGPVVLVAAMVQFPMEAGVQSFACGALANLAHSDPDTGVIIAREGGVDAVLAALHNFTSATSSSGRHRVLQKACWAVLAMASSDFVASHIAGRGGLEVIVAAMRSCGSRPEVQQFGAWALANVAWSDASVQQRAVAAGALEVCEEALERHAATSPGVAEKAELAMQTITAANRRGGE